MEINQEELREQVNRRCMSQKDVAKKIGISEVHLSYCMNEHKKFSAKTAKKINIWAESERIEDILISEKKL